MKAIERQKANDDGSKVLAFEQQPRKGNKAFAAFSPYLSMGPEQSAREVGKKLGKCEGLIER